MNARGTVPTGTITLVVSSTADPEARSGTVAEDALPACAGQPRGIEPGLPQARARVNHGAREPVASIPETTRINRLAGPRLAQEPHQLDRRVPVAVARRPRARAVRYGAPWT